METLFKLGNLLVFPFWALMIFLPHWRWTERIMRAPWVAAVPAVLYAVLMLLHLAKFVPSLLQPELQHIAVLLGTPMGATIGWIHFLAFDLFVGRWIYLDSRRRDVSAWFMAPILFLTLLLGPCGLLLHLTMRRLLGRAEAASDSTLVY